MLHVRWNDINKLIHNIKYNLDKIVAVEKLCHTIKQEMLEELEEIQRIINEQAEGDDEG